MISKLTSLSSKTLVTIFAKESEWDTIPEGGQIEGALNYSDEKLSKYI